MNRYVALHIHQIALKQRLVTITEEIKTLPYRGIEWCFNWVDELDKIVSKQTDCIILDALLQAWVPEPNPTNLRYPPVILLNTADVAAIQGCVKDIVAPQSLNAVVLEQMLRHNIQQAQLEYELNHLKNHDSITGLINQDLFLEQTDAALKQARQNNTPLAILIMNIDNFSKLQSRLSHDENNALLQAFANRLTATLSRHNLASRVQGDEFLVLMQDVNDPIEIERNVQSILQNMRRDFEIGDQRISLTVSIGVGSYPDTGSDRKTIIEASRAARDLAIVKSDSHRMFDAKVAAVSKRRVEVSQALTDVLARRELEVHYQPQITLETSRISGAEALLRWYRPSMGKIEPEFFIPLAEANGTILSIGEWVLRETISEAMRWADEHQANMRLAVNVSGHQFRNQKILRDVENLLMQNDFSPARLELELTERVFVENIQNHRDVFTELNKLGVKIALDDFGIGYSSLNYLKNFSVDTLKIDKSFIAPLPDSKDDAAIVKAIIAMGHSLGMRVVAEGIETETQLQFLHDQQCDEVQGWFFADSLTADQFIKLLAVDEANSSEAD